MALSSLSFGMCGTMCITAMMMMMTMVEMVTTRKKGIARMAESERKRCISKEEIETKERNYSNA